MSASIAVELGDLDAADGFVRDAGALTAVSGNAYDSTHESVIRAALERARGRPQEAVLHATHARGRAEAMALVAFHFYSMALEAAARADAGEAHTAVLVATTALAAVENLQGCEYGLEVRALCALALERAGSPQASEAKRRAFEYATALARSVRDPRLRGLFRDRPINASTCPQADAPRPELRSAEPRLARTVTFIATGPGSSGTPP